MTSAVSAFESIVAAGTALTRTQAAELLSDPDLAGLGMLGDMARRAASDRVAYGRVFVATPGGEIGSAGDAGEIRLEGAPASADEALSRVSAAAPYAGAIPLTGFSLADLLALAGNDHLALAEIAAALRQAGLEAVAEAPLDRLGDADNAIEVVRAALHGGLAVWRLTVAEAPLSARLDLIDLAARLQAETSAVRAFAPLPRLDPVDLPSTGYDDVRTIAAARLMARNIPFIQVDWPLYGPKLAQVAIAFGANDVDGIAPVDDMRLGHRRSPKEDIERQIRAAAGVPAERNGRYEWRA